MISEPGVDMIGYKIPEQGYSPLMDPKLTAEQSVQKFIVYVAGYFDHAFVTKNGIPRKGDKPDPVILEYQTLSPSAGYTKTDRKTTMYPQAFLPGGIDHAVCAGLLNGALPRIVKNGIFRDSRHKVLQTVWPKVELKILWGDRSPWVVPWGIWNLDKHMADVKKAGETTKRPVETVRMPGANHFVRAA